MSMTPQSNRPSGDNSFSAFTVGVLFGVAGALLFGTEEGRKLVKRAVDAVPDKYKTPPVNLGSTIPKIPILPTEETVHQTTYEAPPPPAPAIKPTLAEPFKPQNNL